VEEAPLEQIVEEKMEKLPTQNLAGLKKNIKSLG
jgi:hypothetical protein